MHPTYDELIVQLRFPANLGEQMKSEKILRELCALPQSEIDRAGTEITVCKGRYISLDGFGQTRWVCPCAAIDESRCVLTNKSSAAPAALLEKWEVAELIYRLLGAASMVKPTDDGITYGLAGLCRQAADMLAKAYGVDK